jgi:hypothetical protein
MDDHGDISDTLAPKSEQLDNVELTSGPRVFVVERVEVKREAEQPVRVYFLGFPRPWRPGVTMRRVLAYCWGEKSKCWPGRSIKLFRDPDIRYGKDATGGTRIAAMSDIDGRQEVPILMSQGRAGVYVVEPLSPTEIPAATPTASPTPDQIDACTDIAELGEMWKAHPDARARIEARVAALKAAEPDGRLIPDHVTAAGE